MKKAQWLTDQLHFRQVLMPSDSLLKAPYSNQYDHSDFSLARVLHAIRFLITVHQKVMVCTILSIKYCILAL